MIRSIIPLIAVLLFFLEPVFSLFSPVYFGGELYTLVPRFVIVYLVFIAIYYDRKYAIICGIILGLLCDMFYIDIIGLYAILYPLICIIATSLIHYVHRHIVTTMVLTLFLIALLDILSYGFASLIAITTIGFNEFMSNRLVPTMIANSIFIIMFGWFFKRFMDSKILNAHRETL